MTDNQHIINNNEIKLDPGKLSPGEKMGKYAIIKKIVSDSFAHIYDAKDIWLDKLVTIKIPHFSGKELVNLLAEAKLLAKLDHENIVKLIAAEVYNDIFFMVIEHVDGIFLVDLLKEKKKLEVKGATEIIKQIASAVQYAHMNSIIIRNLMPHYILIEKNNRVRLSDLGTAKLLEYGQLANTSLSITPYMAPEQFLCKPVFASDIYSIGVIFYAMLTGKLPYSGPGFEEKVLKESFISPRILNPAIPQKINDIILKCLERDINNRYQSAGDLLIDLEGGISGLDAQKAVSDIQSKASLPAEEVIVEKAGDTAIMADSKKVMHARKAKTVKKLSLAFVIIIFVITGFIISWKYYINKKLETAKKSQPVATLQPEQADRGSFVTNPKLTRMSQLYSASYALLVGNSDYEYFRKLEYTVTDIEEVAKVLEDLGFNVEITKNLDSGGFRKTMSDFIARKGQDQDAQILIYYAGHGYTEKVAGGENLGYILMIDTPQPKDNYSLFMQKATRMTEIIDYAKLFKSKHVLFMFDSCFSGSILSLRGDIAPEAINESIRNPVREFITAGMADEPVPDRSFFKEVFIKALKGIEGSQHEDGYLTGSELGTILTRKVPDYNPKQHPQFGKIKDPHLDTGDFVFILKKSQPPVEK
ncbi:MAG: hypothetical protein A2Y62_14630 [Candidatus Fischerbacteria bacterium RBG_13_37_8]|uniref:Protein kinase domain-containing protein n=1 Tax=Candidatus Fischerbacteria bacterium RBG_13_37_8 TaxID=1817863 RepID=A0A1F5VMP9_9BACT|nr:MAG: hypothetical protein A2Y62_14630 [Candidatus Fischerbacteria bacterium RBG_13_37_8]